MGIYDAFREYSDARDVLSETALGEPNEQFFKLISEGDLRRRVIGAATARPKPKRVVTAKQLTPEDRDRLNGYVATVVEKSEFDGKLFAAEVRRAMSSRRDVS